jgi:nucleotide-binding universal stress UspA family protein
MNAFSHVLFPVDFSPRCEAAIPFVKEMVRRCCARLTLLHVVEIPVDWYAAVTPSLHMPWDEFETQYKLGRECLGGFACRYFGDISHERPVETICERGDPGYAIVAQAENTGSDLIMMPTHGKGPFRGIFLGSVTARVLHHAECAVWTDAHMETGLSAEYLHIRKILCAVDRKQHAVDLTRGALALAETYGAEVELVHAVVAAEQATRDHFDVNPGEFLVHAATEEITALQEKAGTHLKLHLGAGSVRDVIRDAALKFAADLVIIGRGHIQKPFSRLRSHAYSIIKDSPCPVLSC